MRYRILGPLTVVGDGRQVAVTAGRDRIVLAMMLLHPNRIVGFSELVEAVWGETPPATARGQLHTCVSRLRRLLPADVILTDRAGYGIRVGPEDLDTLVFARLVETARTTQDAETYRRALDLWRGAACAEIDAPGVRQAAAALEEQYLLAVEDWADLELAAGRARQLFAELTPLVERFPLRERLRGQLMLALHRAGRQADALAEYRRARDTLRDELGIDPGAELQAVHREILSGVPAGDPGLVRCLPRTVRDFTGRDGLVRRLLGRIAEADPAEPAVLVVDGMAGSGKTTLALHVAALAGDRYPDAHLFVDLHGHSEQDPVDPAAALFVLLRQLGLSAEAIPADLVGRVGLWRTEVARRRLLVVLDNAASSAQVADLLPASGNSLALVTARRRLSGLDGVRPEPVPLLDAEEAVALLERIAGDRVRAEPQAAAEVVRRCGGLPLAVRLAGARLAQRPHWRVADLVRRLGTDALPELAVENRTVVSAFALSYSHLSVPAQRLFRLLGVYPGTSPDAPAAAALTGLPLDDVVGLLDELVDARLIEEPEFGVYRLHDLLREYAAALPTPAVDRSTAVLGVLNLETHALVATVSTALRSMVERDLKGLPLLRPDLLAAITEPSARLERHRRDLLAFLDAAVRAGYPQYAWWIPRAAWYQLYYRGYNDDVAALNERGLAVAGEHGDDEGMAQMANYVASAHYRTGAYEKASHYLQVSLRIRERQKDLESIARTKGNLASIHISMGRFADAVEVARDSIALGNLTGLQAVQPVTMQMSLAYQRLGRWREALRADRLALLGTLGQGDEHFEAGTLLYIQRSRRRLGLLTATAAQRYVEIALRIAVRLGLTPFEQEVRTELGVVLAEQGRFEEALAQHRIAVEVAAQTRGIRFEADFLNDYAATLRLSGDVPGARAAYERALAVGRHWRNPYAIACATAGLAACADDPEQAVRLRHAADAMFTEMGVAGHPGP
ncbi:AfsR/SARP family transcriptional regulator [Actinoplanes utahensis]|uniref:AfsR family transcriptional regulator n=1 Tax=Actinoplanes utahensis TaxID=1869 RepID=A0A0A6UE14_ACTUT|nr:AfsR/SARP family transcriptional regulator [Actinoplanes utahensis]KHD74270.1 AfsR family transcriptional regulator [Actinoplanes utahensis]GIF31550.1 SARP family transcriptional regulator [Actinoplanes utahensis]